MITTLKRNRLIEAAKLLFYQQGVTGTTLADIAQQAEVPLGNIYYHFRTKEALVEAVIQAHLQELQSLFARLDRQPDPRQRLLGLLAAEREGEHALVRYGCPYGSLAQELNKEDGQPATIAARLLQAYLDWAATQFRLLGNDEQEAKDSALDLIASLQGTFLLSNSFRSPELLERKLQRLETWLCSL
jgi:TetR/AcrR family transcriptional regulator, transcriptional repressor for nem operon